MQRCARCGGHVPDNAVFCAYCGSTFNPVTGRPLTISDYSTARLSALAPPSVSEPRMSTLTGKKERIIRTTSSDYPTSILPGMCSDAIMPTVITGEQSYQQAD